MEEQQFEVNGLNKRDCHRCETSFFPNLKGVVEMNLLCEICGKGYIEAFRTMNLYRCHQTSNRQALTRACISPSFILKFTDWQERMLERPNIEERQSYNFVYKSRMQNRINRQLGNNDKPWY